MQKENKPLPYWDKYVEYMPAYAKNFTDVQKEAIDRLYQLLEDIQKGNHCIPYPCGFGKSTAIRGLIRYVVQHKEDTTTMLVITDRVDRLRGYLPEPGDSENVGKNGSLDVINLSDQVRPREEIQRARIVMLSLQKYNLMDADFRKSLLKYQMKNGGEKDRSFIIIDEAAVSHENIAVKNKDLEKVNGLFRDAIESKDDVDFLTYHYHKFLMWLKREQDRLNSLDNDKEGPITVPFISDRNTVCDPDDRNCGSYEDKFWKLIQKYMDVLSIHDPSFKKLILVIRNLINPGARTLYLSKAVHRNYVDYRSFITTLDYRGNLDGRIPAFVLDGTAMYGSSIRAGFRLWRTVNFNGNCKTWNCIFTRLRRILPTFTGTVGKQNGW